MSEKYELMINEYTGLELKSNSMIYISVFEEKKKHYETIINQLQEKITIIVTENERLSFAFQEKLEILNITTVSLFFEFFLI